MTPPKSETERAAPAPLSGELRAVIDGVLSWAYVVGDCAEILPTLPRASVDHVLMDPPYSAHVHKAQRLQLSSRGARRAIDGAKRRAVVDAPLGFEALSGALRQVVSEETARICRRWCLAFSDAESVNLWMDDLTGAGMKHIRVGAWIKLAGQPQLSGDRPGAGFEAIEIAHAAAVRPGWNGGGHLGVWPHYVANDRTAGGGDRIHPTQKPLALMLELVRQFTAPGDLVIDPFAGSATTGIACLRLGRRFIGIERSADFAAKGLARLQAETEGLTLTSYRRGQIALFAGGGR